VAAALIKRREASEAPQTGWREAQARIRNQVKEWIRERAGFDSVIDFDKIGRSGADPNLINPPYNCGDGIHPSPIGYFQMGKSVDLGLFLK